MVIKQSPILLVPPHGQQFKKHCYMELWSDHYSAVYQILTHPLWHLLHFKLQHKHNGCYWIQTFPYTAMKCYQVINCLKFIKNVSDMASVIIISNYSKTKRLQNVAWKLYPHTDESLSGLHRQQTPSFVPFP